MWCKKIHMYIHIYIDIPAGPTEGHQAAGGCWITYITFNVQTLYCYSLFAGRLIWIPKKCTCAGSQYSTIAGTPLVNQGLLKKHRAMRKYQKGSRLKSNGKCKWSEHPQKAPQHSRQARQASTASTSSNHRKHSKQASKHSRQASKQASTTSKPASQVATNRSQEGGWRQGAKLVI